MATINGNLITLDGIFSDWAANDMIMTAANAVLNYQVYGAFVANATVTNTNSTPDNTYVIGIDATDPSDPVIGAGTIIYLNTDQNNTTGFSPFGGVNTVGAEYEVQFAIDTNTSDSTFNTLQAYLYSVTPGGVPTLVSTTPLASNINGGSVELAIPQSLLTPDGGTPPTTLDFAALISSQGLPAPFSASTPEYIIPDTAAAPAPTTIANTITLDGTFGDWPAAPPAPGTVGVIVPAYFNPATDPSDWAAMTAAAAKIPLTAILNPNSGPGTSQDPGYVTAINALEAAGGKVVGYVDTAGGTVALSTVEAEISTYVSFYNVNGIFLDNMVVNPTTLSYYQQLEAYIKGLNSAYTVIGNVGNPVNLSGLTPTDYLSVADVLNIYEGTSPGASTPVQNWIQSYSSSRFSSVIYDAPSSSLAADIIGAEQLNSGSVFVTDQTLPNPYGQLPSYWNQEVSDIASVSEPSDSLMTPGNTVSGYQVYGALLNDATLGKTYAIGIDATNSADPVIAAGTTLYLNTDQNNTTGFSPFGAVNTVGAEYEVQFLLGANSVLQPYLYSVTAGGVLTELNSGQPLPFSFSSNGESLELAVQQSLLTPTAGAVPTSINFDVLINNGVPAGAALPGDFTSAPYTITDPSTLVPVNHAVKKVAIIYSATTAAQFFGLAGPQAVTAYDDLFLDAQHQAEAAGVSYDILTEADLTGPNAVANLAQYSALIFPNFQNVQSSQVSAIENTLTQVVYNYHVPIITGGEFMTNDQAGAALPGNVYASMQQLLGVTQSGFGTGTYSVTPDAAALASNNPVIAGYTAGEALGGASGQFAGQPAGMYTDAGYLTFSGVGGVTATTLADINLQAGAATSTTDPTTGVTTTTPATTSPETLPGVVQTTTGGTNTIFSTTGLEGDSNLLQHAIQNAVFGTTPSLTMDITRFAGVLDSRTDMDQSQYPDDVNPALNGGTGIYDKMIPILQTLKNEYDFVGSYYINVGDDANPANANMTDWTISDTYYDELLQMGNEIGDHSETHLIDPPTTTVTETTASDTPLGSTQIKVSALPSYNGATVGMTVTGLDIGANTIVSAVSGDATLGYTLTLLYMPGGYGTANLGVTGDLPAGSTLTFGVPAENTNFLSTGTGTGTNAFTYDYEFGTSKATEGTNIGITIAGAAVPGAPETAITSDNIEQDFQSVPGGLTGYVNGGWTGVGSGSPNAFGYIDPTDTGSVYIAPNITFDFSEVEFQDKSAGSAELDWEALFNQLSQGSDSPVIVWPWHDYGITDWPTNGPGTPPPGYTPDMYSQFVAQAFAAGYEFVTTEDLAARIAAQQAATLSETTNGNVITATVTPGAAEPDLGAMALNVTNGAAGQVIKNAGAWYAYDSNSVFLANDAATPTTPEKFTVTLGATQDDVTHVDSLPMRADLQSVTGDGSNLTLAMTGDGTLGIHVKTPGTNIISVQTSVVGPAGTGGAAPTATLVGGELQLIFNDGALPISTASPQGVGVLHDIAVTEGPIAVAGATFVFFAPPTIAGTHPTPTVSDAAVDPFTGVTIGDLNTGATDTLTITLSNSGATGALSGMGLSGGTNGVYTLSGTAAAVTTALDGLVFTPVTGAPGSVTTTTFALSDLSTGLATPTSDSTTTVTDTDAVAPTIAGTHATPTSSDIAVNPFTSVTIGDLNANATDMLTITLSNGGTTGVLTGAGLTGGTNGVYTLSGAAATVTSELDTLLFAPAKGAPGSATTTTFALSDVSSGFATPTNDSTTTVTDVDLLAPAITSATYTGSASTGHWILAGAAAAGSTVTVYDGTTSLGTTLATVGGTWSFSTTRNSAAIRVFTVTATLAGLTSVASAPYYEGTGNADVLSFVSEAVLSAAALISGGGGTDTLQMTAPATLTDADFAHAQAIEILGLTGASSVTLGPNASAAGITTVTPGAGATSITDTNNTALTINATGLGAGNLLTLAGSTVVGVTNLTGNLSATSDTGALTVTATAAAAQAIATGSGATLINDSNTAGSVVVDATALATNTLTIGGDVTTTVNNLAGNLVMLSTGSLIVTADGSGAQSVTTGMHNTSITDTGSGSMTVNNASGFTASYTLTLSGSAPETVINLSDSLVATGLTGALNVTTKATPLSIATGAGPNTINAGAMTSALTLTGSTAATVTALGGNLTATGDSGALTVTTTGAAQTVTTGSGSISITDNSTGLLTVNGAALAAGSLLTLTGSGPVTVTNLKGGLNATGDTGALTVTATATTAQTIATGSGAMSLTDSAAGGSVVVDATKLGTGTLTLAGSAAATVNNLAGNLVVNGAGVTTVNATGSAAQSVTTGTGNMSIAGSGSGGVNVNANATGGGKILTLSGTAAETVTNLGESIVATGLTGALNVTTKTNALSIATGAGPNTINAGLMTGALTLTGSTAATVTALHGNLTATGDSGALTVTTNGAAQTMTTGSGNLSIADNSTGLLTVNGAALAAGSLLTLTGSGPVTVTNLKGDLNATGDTGALTVTATATTAQTIATGSGAMSIADSTSALTINAAALSVSSTLTLTGTMAKTVTNLSGSLIATSAAPISVTATGSGPQSITTGAGADTIVDQTSGGDTINGGGAADTINVSGHAGADSFTYSATTDSRNTTTGHDTIAGFGHSDLLNFSALNANLHTGALQAAGSQIAADSIAWVNTGSAMDVYINDTGAALATTNITNTGLMEITLTGVSSLSASNFHA